MSDYYDRDGDPIDLTTFSQLCAANTYRCIGDSTVTVAGAEVEITTIWLGINFRFVPGPPLIFESVIHAPGVADLDGMCVRYETLAAAISGHDQIHAALRDGRTLVPTEITGRVTP